VDRPYEPPWAAVAVLEIEMEELAEERAGVFLLTPFVQTCGQSVFRQNSPSVRGQVPGTGSAFDALTALALQDQTVDAFGQQHVAEYEARWSSADDKYGGGCDRLRLTHK
jgi:hypothetical protein